MVSKFVHFKEVTLHYLKYGYGSEALICFHGYGQNASVFQPLAEALGSKYTLYSFDLFFHGKSEWKDCGLPLSSDFLAQIFEYWINQEKLTDINFCGYSLGGKIIISLLQKTKIQVKKILLIAPDGIKTNFWYDLATYPYWARRIFKYTVEHPSAFFRIVDVLGDIGVLDNGVVRFAKSQMNDRTKREKVYNTWLIYRKLRPELQTLSRKINAEDIYLVLYLGKFDKIITFKRVQPLLTQLNQYDFFLLNKGHNNLIKEVAKDKSLNF
ncbi:alpha/beta hydrolase [Catalinimonas sp. 4WD22]|uniref:alpha/beta hydrolase n=1 Tax=Catalinimonas locisalis TaxID=3133978 RepID=UPI003100FA62